VALALKVLTLVLVAVGVHRLALAVLEGGIPVLLLALIDVLLRA
jgi:hypothetical protein